MSDKQLTEAELALVGAYRSLPDAWREEADHYLNHNEPALALEIWVLALMEISPWFREVTMLTRTSSEPPK